MLRELWQWVKDNAIDPVTNLFKSQEEIDSAIDAKLGNWGVVTHDTGDIPLNAKLRRNVFLSPDDLIKYIKDGGIPSDYCTILEIDDWDEDGNRAYALYVVED